MALPASGVPPVVATAPPAGTQWVGQERLDAFRLRLIEEARVLEKFEPTPDDADLSKEWNPVVKQVAEAMQQFQGTADPQQKDAVFERELGKYAKQLLQAFNKLHPSDHPMGMVPSPNALEESDFKFTVAEAEARLQRLTTPGAAQRHNNDDQNAGRKEAALTKWLELVRFMEKLKNLQDRLRQWQYLQLMAREHEIQEAATASTMQTDIDARTLQYLNAWADKEPNHALSLAQQDEDSFPAGVRPKKNADGSWYLDIDPGIIASLTNGKIRTVADARIAAGVARFLMTGPTDGVSVRGGNTADRLTAAKELLRHGSYGALSLGPSAKGELSAEERKMNEVFAAMRELSQSRTGMLSALTYETMMTETVGRISPPLARWVMLQIPQDDKLDRRQLLIKHAVKTGEPTLLLAMQDVFSAELKKGGTNTPYLDGYTVALRNTPDDKVVDLYEALSAQALKSVDTWQAYTTHSTNTEKFDKDVDVLALKTFMRCLPDDKLKLITDKIAEGILADPAGNNHLIVMLSVLLMSARDPSAFLKELIASLYEKKLAALQQNPAAGDVEKEALDFARDTVMQMMTHTVCDLCNRNQVKAKLPALLSASHGAMNDFIDGSRFDGKDPAWRSAQQAEYLTVVSNIPNEVERGRLGQSLSNFIGERLRGRRPLTRLKEVVDTEVAARTTAAATAPAPGRAAP